MTSMPSRICTSCHEPHITTDWYIIEWGSKHAGDIECADAHENRIRRETRLVFVFPLCGAGKRDTGDE